MIRFLYEQELIALDDVPADLTVLDWLRLHKRRTGTKEGCGSGDCGACTVVTASVVSNSNGDTQLHYASVNSCITFVGSLHGKQLLTVESLSAEGVLHPVQQAMVDEHGSQCGFCTPGFVMSLYALYQQDDSEEILRSKVEQCLGGNLCRCTGYRPIKAAAEKALDVRANQKAVSANPSALILQLESLRDSTVIHKGFHQPHTVSELATLYQQQPDARLLAGGTDLALEVTQQMKTLPHIIHIGRVAELCMIEVNADSLVLGAAVTLTQCLELMSEHIPPAREMLLRFGSDQIRNQATIGGNIGSASPIGDLPPLLLALDATLTLQCGEAQRTVAMQNYYQGYRQTCLQAGEFIRHVHLSLPGQDSILAVHKVSKRTDDDISSVCLAVHLAQQGNQTADVRLAFGGMAATPVRANSAESALNGRAFDQSAICDAQRALAAELHPISDARASADYRLQIAQNLLQRVLLESVA